MKMIGCATPATSPEAEQGPHPRGDAFVTLFPIVVLAIIQGLTEFLPVSSSSHLVLLSKLVGQPEQNLVIVIAIHIGTLLAVTVYFWRDIWEMVIGVTGLFTGRKGPGLRLFLYLLVATIPVLLVGYFGLRYIKTVFHHVEVIAWTTLIFGLVLGLADRLCMTVRRIEHMNYAGALFVGLAQVLALVSGTSRAGITMTACRFLGIERRDSARFSMLLAIPAILGSAALAGVQLHLAGGFALRPDAVLAAVVAFFVALIAISLTMRWLVHGSFAPFVVYRVVLGAGLLYWVYS
jgi:undecaprenyl-diphosphatase